MPSFLHFFPLLPKFYVRSSFLGAQVISSRVLFLAFPGPAAAWLVFSDVPSCFVAISVAISVLWSRRKLGRHTTFNCSWRFFASFKNSNLCCCTPTCFVSIFYTIIQEHLLKYRIFRIRPADLFKKVHYHVWAIRGRGLLFSFIKTHRDSYKNKYRKTCMQTWSDHNAHLRQTN